MIPNKSEIHFGTKCIICDEPIYITFDDDGDVEGNIIQCGVTHSNFFGFGCTPLGLSPIDQGGFRHGYCSRKTDK